MLTELEIGKKEHYILEPSKSLKSIRSYIN